MNQVRGSVTVEDLDADYVLSAIQTVAKSAPVNGWLVPWPGAKSPSELLDWAMVEIIAAMDALNAGDRERCATNAVVTARRALASMLDWYLTGFGFKACKGAPATSWDMSTRLLERGIFDRLTCDVLAHAIDVRNNIEHRYKLRRPGGRAGPHRIASTGLRAPADTAGSGQGAMLHRVSLFVSDRGRRLEQRNSC